MTDIQKAGRLAGGLAALLLMGGSVFGDGDRWRVAEWGTFTVLQNERGEALPGVNVNEERLPPFVHRLGHIVPDVSEISPVAGPRSKGIPSSYPLAIMRMETPIIYFYPPKPLTKPVEVDVRVGFNGGWISEWYPNASVEAPGFRDSDSDIGRISPDATGTIDWKGISVGGDAELPSSGEHVWLAPRDVDSAKVTTAEGQSEQYLFYRGVGSIEAPLRVVRDAANRLDIQTNGPLLSSSEPFPVSAMWLVDIRPDGKVAFRQLPAFTVPGGQRQTIATLPGMFDAMHYSAEKLVELRESMYSALMAEGLTSRKADAMLNTWKLSYFQSPGLRLFFTLPQSWTDAVLPLSVSVPADMTRVMIGRIELITPEQRQLVSQIAAGPVSTTKWLYEWYERQPEAERALAWQQLYNEEKSFADLNIAVPKDYQAFLDLGRFRDAIVLDQLRHQPTESLKQFTQNYYLHRFGEPPAE